jgi:cell division protein FtsZ
MAINLSAPRATELKPRIVVFGVGGAGGNAVNNMIDAGLEGVEFVVANTDAQQLAFSRTDRRIQLGVSITQGLGAGADPGRGMSAAEESYPEIEEQLDGAHMVFITAGMGGGTGTGAAPMIAKAARERGILTVGVVTKPFTFEGRHRMRLADAGVSELTRYVDTLIVIPNQNLFRVANERTTFTEAFAMADQVLHSGVRSITDLMVLPGLINLDFADVRAVMSEMGKAMMGTGEATGEDRALMAAHNAIQNPLLDEVSLKGARAVLVNVTGGLDMTLLEVDEAANAISSEVDPDANIIFGAAFDPSLEGCIRVSVVATGMGVAEPAAAEPAARTVAAPPAPPAARPVAARTISRPIETAPAWPEPMRGQAVAAAPASEPEPAPVEFEPALIVQPRQQAEAQDAYVQPRRIVDINAAEAGDERDLALQAPPRAAAEGARSYSRPGQPPLPDPRQSPEPRRGFMSLFGGRPRYDAPVQAPAPSRSTGGQGAAARVEPVDASDDLEIPSFLRRLAN